LLLEDDDELFEELEDCELEDDGWLLLEELDGCELEDEG